MFLRWANLGISTTALNLLKIAIMTLTAGHFFACFFFAVAEYEGHTDEVSRGSEALNLKAVACG